VVVGYGAHGDCGLSTLDRLRGQHLLPLAMFFGTFAWSFVYISLPFHIHNISPWDEARTLRWTGWILGISPLTTVMTAPLWGRLAERGDPKRFYVIVQWLQGIAFFGTAVARTLPELFFCRLVLGVTGAASTFAFIGAGRLRDPKEVRREIAAMQSAMTVGQVIGPLVGAIAAVRLGFRESFVVGGLVLIACGLLVAWGVPSKEAGQVKPGVTRPPARWTSVLAVSMLVLGGSTQVFFLTSILPQVLPPLGVPTDRTLEVGGMLIFASGVAAALGSLAVPRLSDWLPERTLITVLLVVSSVALGAFALAGSVWSYGTLRFVQVLCIAPLFPIVVARIAQSAGGAAIGVINSARIGAAFVGPVVATTLLAVAPPLVLYLVLAAAGLACIPLARVRDIRAAAA
jgi:DHA1 family multidrug resistance protein-like MFS transporter